MRLLSDCFLYTFVDLAYAKGRSIEDVARQLCDGGSDLIQLRAKAHSPGEIAKMAETLLPITSQAGVGLVINDYPDIARRVGAQFAHLGQEDFFDVGHANVSEIAPPAGTLQIGLSSHAPDQAKRAVAAGAHYVAVGPVYPTATKPTAQAVTLDYVRWAAAHVNIPWFAIGGITLENLDAVMEAGARRLCIVSAILNAAKVADACQKFKNRLVSAPGNG